MNLTKRQRFLGFVGILCAIVAIFEAVRAYSEDAFIEVAATFLGAVLGAVLAAGVGLWLLSQERSQIDDDRRNQLLTALASEVRASQIILRGRPTPVAGPNDEVFGGVVMVALPSIVVEECARSGLFSFEYTNDFFNLAGHIQVHNAEVTFFQSTRTGLVSRVALRVATAEMNNRQQELCQLYEDWKRRIEL